MSAARFLWEQMEEGATKIVVNSVVAGDGVTVDATDPNNPIVSASGGLVSHTKDISAADLVAWYDLPPGSGAVGKEFVPAPGAGYVIFPIYVAMEWKQAAAALDNGGASLSLSFDDASGPQVLLLALPTLTTSSKYKTTFFGDSDDVLTKYADVPLMGYIDEAVTTGDTPTGTLRVTVYYMLFATA